MSFNSLVNGPRDVEKVRVFNSLLFLGSWLLPESESL
jgi:hypothetical protein